MVFLKLCCYNNFRCPKSPKELPRLESAAAMTDYDVAFRIGRVHQLDNNIELVRVRYVIAESQSDTLRSTGLRLFGMAGRHVHQAWPWGEAVCQGLA